MGVVSKAQLEKRRAEKRSRKASAISVEKAGIAAPAIVPSTEWRFAFPEIMQGRPKNFKNKAMIGGTEREYSCVNDMVKTTDAAVAEHLIERGYILLEKKEIES